MSGSSASTADNQPAAKNIVDEFTLIKPSNYEELFSNRYTATDEDYVKKEKIEALEPICIFPWYVNQSAPRQNNNRYNNNGRYNNNQNQRWNNNRDNSKRRYNDNNYNNSDFKRRRN